MTGVQSRPLPTGLPEYFNCIDAIRLLAAIVVVIFHYHHFYLVDHTARDLIPDTETFPLASVFGPFFRDGHKAVELFWIISGFVFAHVYLHSPTSLGKFAVARFARLYPLHLATLILVAAVQIVSLRYAGHWQIYGNNDAWNFMFQMFMASQLTSLTGGLSFNGPIWSVSVEIGAYAIFFCALPLIRRSGFVAALLLALLFTVLARQSVIDIPLVQRGVFVCAGYFFGGVTLYFAFGAAVRRRLGLPVLILACVGAGLIGHRLQMDVLAEFIWGCGLVLAAGWCDQRIGKAGLVLRSWGNISYGLYLVHVPLQMVILLIADLVFDGTRDFAASPALLPLFLVGSVMLAIAAFVIIERPAGRAIRARLAPRD